MVVLALQTPPARRWVLSRITELLAAQEVDLDIRQLDYNLFNLSLRIHDVSVRSRTTPQLPPFATVADARVDLSLLALVRGRYVVQRGLVSGVMVHYLVDDHGLDNLPHPPRDPDTPSRSLDYLLEHFTLNRSEVRYEDRRAGIDLVLPVQSMEVVGHDLSHRHDIRLTSTGGTLRSDSRTVPLERFAVAMAIGNDDASISGFELDAAGSHAALTGTLKDFEAPVVDLRIRGRFNLSSTARLAGVQEPVDGTAEVEGRVRGFWKTPVIDGRLAGEAISARGFDGNHVSFVGAYDMKTAEARIDDLRIDGPAGSVAANGLVWTQGTGASRAEFSVTALDADRIMRALRMPYIAKARLDARGSARWTGLDYMNASGSATARLTPTSREASRSALPVGGRVNVLVRSGLTRVDVLELAAGGATIKGRVDVNRQRRLSGELRSDIADVGRVASTAEAFLDRRPGSLLPTTTSGAATISARLAGTIDAPGAAAEFSAPALTVGSAKGVALTGRADGNASSVSVETMDMVWHDARAHADGRIDFKQGRRLDVRFEADRLSVADILAAARHPEVAALGTLRATGTASGTLDAPVASATVTGEGLVAYDEVLGHLTANAVLNGRELRVEEVLLEKPEDEGGGRLAGSGSYHLDTRVYQFSLTGETLGLTRLVLPDGRAVRGVLGVDARGAGSIDMPQADVQALVESAFLAELELGRIAVTAHVANQQAIVEATAERFHATADAAIGLIAPYPSRAELHVDALDLSVLPVSLDTPVDGLLSGRAEAHADLAQVSGADVEATIDSLAGHWRGQAFSLGGPALFHYADEQLDVDRLHVVAQDSSVILSGSFPIGASGKDGDISVEGHANLATLVKYAPVGTELDGEGSLDLVGRIRGRRTAIDPDLTLTVKDARINGPDITPGVSALEIEARMVDGAARLERLVARLGSGRVEARGVLPLGLLPFVPEELVRDLGPADLRAAIQDVDPGQFAGAPRDLWGLVSAEAEITAPHAALSALTGTIAITEFDFGFNGLTLSLEHTARLGIAGGALTAEPIALSGSVGEVTAAGRLGLTGNRPIDARLSGYMDAAIVTFFTDAVRAEGETTLEVAALGTVSSPRLTGFVQMNDVTMVLDEPRIASEHIQARLDLADGRLVLNRLTADVNGGTLEASGSSALLDGSLHETDVRFELKAFAFDAPLDLRSRSDSSIHVSQRNGEILIAGQVIIEEAGLTGDINFDTGLVAAMTARRQLDLTEERNALLEQVRFDIQVDSATPVLVDNNLAKAEVETNVRVVGTPYETGLSGRLTVVEGGTITLNEREYEVERAIVTFVEDRRIFPSFDLLLNTSASRYDITISVSGTPGETETTLTADPVLPEPDIMALLVAGRTLDEMRGQEYEVAQEQVLSYLTGRIGSTLGRGIERVTGLSQVRIEPNLIANEIDPGARLTVGQDLTDELSLVYSTNLADSSDQVWVAEYDISRRFQTRAVRQADNSYRADFRHDVRFGGRPAPPRVPRHRPSVNVVSFEIGAPVEEDTIHSLFGVRPGDEYDYFKASKGIDRIQKFLREQGFLQSRARLNRTVSGNRAALRVEVVAGPRVDLQFEGITPPRRVQDQVRLQWQRGVFDAQRTDDVVETVTAWLMADRYLRAKVDVTVEEPGPGRDRRVLVRINPGPRSTQVRLVFEGASAVKPEVLQSIIDEQELELKLFTDPLVVTGLLKRYYREQGYLSSTLETPRNEFDGEVARVVIKVDEGPRFRVRRVETRGNAVVASSAILTEVPLAVGGPFLPSNAELGLERIRDLYWRRGYNDVRSEYDLVVDREAGMVDVRFAVAEGPQSVVADITVGGNEKTSERLVRGQLTVATQQPLDLAALSKSRRNLYDTGAFSIVDITHTDADATTGGDVPAAPSQAVAVDPSTARPVHLDVSVREVQPIHLTYGASYDTERGLGGILDFSIQNSLGKARVLGVRTRYDGQVREVRGYFSQPSLLMLPFQTELSLYRRDELNPGTERFDGVDVSRRGASVQQETRLSHYLVTYGYRYERVKTQQFAEGGPLATSMAVSPLLGSLVRDERDDVLDATRGSFMSHALTYSPSWLGADQGYVKYMGQYFRYLALTPPRRTRLTNELVRPRLIYAGGVRVGLARGFGGDVPLSEWFVAGGSTTVRGFAQNSLGSGDDGLAGGAAMLVINNELRFPLFRLLDGAVFTDIGNVFDRVSEMSLGDLRSSAGAGLRIRTPWFLIRGDYGFVLDRRSGEPGSHVFFSIGQAF